MQYEPEWHANDDQSTVFVIERDQVVRSALHYILQERYRTYTFASLDDALASAMDAPDAVRVGTSILQGENDGIVAALGRRYCGAAVLVVTAAAPIRSPGSLSNAARAASSASRSRSTRSARRSTGV